MRMRIRIRMHNPEPKFGPNERDKLSVVVIEADEPDA